MTNRERVMECPHNEYVDRAVSADGFVADGGCIDCLRAEAARLREDRDRFQAIVHAVSRVLDPAALGKDAEGFGLAARTLRADLAAARADMVRLNEARLKAEAEDEATFLRGQYNEAEEKRGKAEAEVMRLRASYNSLIAEADRAAWAIKALVEAGDELASVAGCVENGPNPEFSLAAWAEAKRAALRGGE